MQSTITISVIVVTCKNRSKKLERCLLSILENDFPPNQFEILVVNSGAGEESRQIVATLAKNHPQHTLKWLVPENPATTRIIRVRPLYTAVNQQSNNIGAAKARNLAIKASRGEIIAFTDDDCVVPKKWLKTHFSAYQSHPEVAGAGGITLPPEELINTNVFAYWEAEMYRKALPKGHTGQTPYLSTKRDEHPVYTGNISYKKAVLERVGGFGGDFPPNVYGEDGDLKERVLTSVETQSSHIRPITPGNVAGLASLLFVPTVVRHHDSYDFKTFWYKNQCRGRGVAKFKEDHQFKEKRGVVWLKLACSPLAWILYLVKSKLNFKLAWLETLAYLARQTGKLTFSPSPTETKLL